MAVTVVVLQAFTHQGGTSGGCAEQKASSPRVPCGPEQITDPLEAEHRIEDVERQGHHAMVGVGGTGRDPG